MWQDLQRWRSRRRPDSLDLDAAHGNARSGRTLKRSASVDLYTGALQRFDPIADGLPVANKHLRLRHARVPHGSGLWLGTDRGLARRMPAGNQSVDTSGSPWRFYGGRRWMPGYVRAVAR